MTKVSAYLHSSNKAIIKVATYSGTGGKLERREVGGLAFIFVFALEFVFVS